VSHWIVMPIVTPALLAPLMVLLFRRNLMLQRLISLGATVALLGVAIALFEAARGAPEVYLLGGWPAPFGIVMVLDRLAAVMVLLTAVLGLGVVGYAVASRWDERGRHFHPLMQFQLMGVCGAFLTGDIFNLFVFFEVMLIASYGLMLHGGGPARLRAGLQYIVVNLAGSTLFLFAVGAIYAATGTLNMADLAMKAGEATGGDAMLLRVGGLLLLIVFGVKAALVPLHFWLPVAYAAAPAPAAAFFAIMTKVGAYAVLRVYTLVFGADAGAATWLAYGWLVPAALVTLAVGAVGALGARTLSGLVCFSVIASMGTLFAAVGVFTQTATAAALFYLVHSTLATAALFLLIEAIAARRPAGEALTPGPAMAQGETLGGLFLLAAIAMAGMPPLGGFLGKLMVLDAARDDPAMWWVWGVVLTGSLLMVVAFARAGSLLFWKAEGAAPPRAAGAGPVWGAGYLLAAVVAFTVWSGPAARYLEATAAQLHAPQAYIAAVLGTAALVEAR
jgi:multicomponent K+:H+ antiporter subunit D